MSRDQTRIYNRADSVVFLKTNELFGGLSNMAGGFPLRVNGIRIRTSEALYQACRFPHLPQVQRLIIGQKSPMTAKMKSKPYRQNSRPDWYQVRVKIMRWCLRVKLAQNWGAFSKLLLETGYRPIVEQSWKDDFWGASPVDKHTLIGMNVLGRLLMELREAVKIEERRSFLQVEPLDIRDFQLDGRPIETVAVPNDETGVEVAYPVEHPSCVDIGRPMAIQHALFDSQVAKDAPLPGYTGEKSKSAGLSNIKFYPDMKNSGVEWLGDVPAHWEVLPNRAIFAEVNERNHPDEQMLSVTITKGVIHQRALLEDSSKKDASRLDRSDYKLVRLGDLAYNKMRAWQGAVGASEYHGIVSPAYVVHRPRNGANSRYLHYLLRTPAFAREAERWSYGITSDMWSLRPEHFKMIYACVPPLPEQHRIAAFLDQKTAEIDEAISKKQRLIDLLKEQKAILINQAVTKGLNPNVPMRDSGVEWIGEVPAHWEVVRLKHAWNILDCKHLTAPVFSEGYPLASIKEVQGKKVNLDTANRTNRKFYERLIDGGRRPLVGDIIYSRNVTVGAAALVDSAEEFALGQDVCLLKSVENYGLYFVHLLRSNAVIDQLSHFLVGSTFNRINISQIKELLVCVPPREEQERIAVHTDTLELEFEAVIKKASQEQETLKELSQVLISQAVTGKIKV